MRDAVVHEFGRVDIIVNNASVAIGKDRAPVIDVARPVWERLFDVNVTGSFLVAKHFGALLVAQGEGGSIINISSAAGKTLPQTRPPMQPRRPLCRRSRDRWRRRSDPVAFVSTQCCRDSSIPRGWMASGAVTRGMRWSLRRFRSDEREVPATSPRSSCSSAPTRAPGSQGSNTWSMADGRSVTDAGDPVDGERSDQFEADGCGRSGCVAEVVVHRYRSATNG